MPEELRFELLDIASTDEEESSTVKELESVVCEEDFVCSEEDNVLVASELDEIPAFWMLDDVISLAVLSMGKTAGFSSPQAEKRKAKNPASKKNLLIRIATSALVNIYKFIAMGVKRFYSEASASFTQRTE